MDVIEVSEGRNFRKSTWQAELAPGVVRPHAAEEPRIIFGTALGFSNVIQQLHETDTGLPFEFTSMISRDLNGHFGSREREKIDGEGMCHEMWYTFKIKQVINSSAKVEYYWTQISVFARWNVQNSMGLILCLDCPAPALEDLKRNLVLRKISSSTCHVRFLETVRDLYNYSVWSLRDYVRGLERDRDREQGFTPNFVHLHDMARHLIHSNETLQVAIETIQSIRARCTHMKESNFDDQTYALQKELKAIKCRSESLRERLQNEINLAFNLVAQRESRIMVGLGNDSRKDSNTMSFIAVVGLVYLPGTFISGLFGTNFFNVTGEPGQEKWLISNNFWLYWALTIPITFVTIFSWVLAFHGKDLRERTMARIRRSRIFGKESVVFSF